MHCPRCGWTGEKDAAIFAVEHVPSCPRCEIPTPLNTETPPVDSEPTRVDFELSDADLVEHLKRVCVDAAGRPVAATDWHTVLSSVLLNLATLARASLPRSPERDQCLRKVAECGSVFSMALARHKHS